MWDTIAENEETEEEATLSCDAAIAAAKKYMLYPDPDCICWCCVKVSKMDAAAGANIGGIIAMAKETLLDAIAVPGPCQGDLAKQEGKDRANGNKYYYCIISDDVNPDGAINNLDGSWLSIQYEEFANTKGEPKCDGR